MPGKELSHIELPGGRSFTMVIYDLLFEPVDCIVNAANGGLSHGGGVAAAIDAAAGPALAAEGREIIEQRGRIPVGDAVVTTAGKLPFKGVIHAVGPRLGDGDEEGKLVQTLYSAFDRATERGWMSLSFPGVSSGIFAVPAEVCARAYIRAVRMYFVENPQSSLKSIRLCLLQGPLVDVVRKEIDRTSRARPTLIT